MMCEWTVDYSNLKRTIQQKASIAPEFLYRVDHPGP